MSLKDQRSELQRLLHAFENEAAHFHDARLSTIFLTQTDPPPQKPVQRPNHAIMLWQYYGPIGTQQDIERIAQDVQDSNLNWGITGAQLSSFAIVEGSACPLFVRMAQRAGSLFDATEAFTIKSRVIDEICALDRARHPSAKPTAVTNDNPLAIWLNYLLYHVSQVHPGRQHRQTIEPDPFSLSLLAVERLAADLTIEKVDRSVRPLKELSFRVAMSFPGEHRVYVSKVVGTLRSALGPDAVFYDHDYQAQLARPNLDTLLQHIYRHQSELIVVFLGADYANKTWCGLEWRAIRDIIKERADDRVMFVRFDDAPVEGVFSIDGYIDARSATPQDIAAFITERLARRPGHSD